MYNNIVILLFSVLISLNAHASKADRVYDHSAKNTYSHNDVKAFVYSWFAGFDHQDDVDYFRQYLRKGRVDMYFPDFPIKSIDDFERWYQGVVDNIHWNTHILNDVKVEGSQEKGFNVIVNLVWKAKSYDGDNYELNLEQEWFLLVDEKQRFYFKRHTTKITN